MWLQICFRVCGCVWILALKNKKYEESNNPTDMRKKCDFTSRPFFWELRWLQQIWACDHWTQQILADGLGKWRYNLTSLNVVDSLSIYLSILSDLILSYLPIYIHICIMYTWSLTCMYIYIHMYKGIYIYMHIYINMLYIFINI